MNYFPLQIIEVDAQSAIKTSLTSLLPAEQMVALVDITKFNGRIDTNHEIQRKFLHYSSLVIIFLQFYSL